MTAPDRPKRRRRLASDEAHSWARSLRLGNPYAKSVLKSLTLYVNDEAVCFVSIGQLAEDCDLSEDTVRRRLKFLEDIGAIVRFPRWCDEQGRSNFEGRGKRTTDDIRLLIDADLDEIEAKATGSREADGTAAAVEPPPSQQQGLTEEVRGALAPPLGVRQPSQSCDQLISEPEPEPEVSSQPSSGGPPEIADDFKEFEEAWAEPITRPSLARQVWSSLTGDERTAALRAAVGYHLWRRQQTKPPHMLGAQIFLRERESWPKFAGLAQRIAPPEGVWIAEGSDEDRALRLVRSLARTANPFVLTREGVRGYLHKTPVGEDLLAMLTVADQTPLRWPAFKRGTPEFAAWQARFTQWTGVSLPVDPALDAIRAPWQWPPSKDGRIYEDGDSQSSPS